MASIIRRVRELLRMGGELTQDKLQPPKNTGEYGDNEYERFKEYIAALRTITLKELIIPVIMLFSEYDILRREGDDSIGMRRLIVNTQTGPGLFKYDEGYREKYAGIYEQITPTLLTILVDWFHSIALPPKQEQTGQTDNPNSILEKIIGIINSSNSDKRRELVLKLLEAIGFRSDQSIKDCIAAHLNKKPEESELLKLINPELLQTQGLTLKYIIRLLEAIFDFKLPSGENLLDQIFQNNQDLSDISLNEIKDLIKLILLWDRWCKLKPYTEKLSTIEEKIASKPEELLYQDTYALEEIIRGANPNLPLLKPESGDDSLPRNLIQIIVTISFGEIYQKAQELHPQGMLVIFEKKLERLKNVTEKEKTDSWFEQLEELLSSVAQYSYFLFKEQVNENPEIVLSYADIFYKIWLLIIEFNNLKIKLRLPEIQIFCDAREIYLKSIQGGAKTINERENSSKIEKLTEIINFINEYLTLLYRLFGNDRTVRTVFLDSLKFLENPDLDRVKQKLQEITDLLDQISGLLDGILKIIEKEIQKLNAQIDEPENIEKEIQKLNAQIAKLKNVEEKIQKLKKAQMIAELKKTIAVTISDIAISDKTISDKTISDESPAAYIAAYTGETRRLSDLPGVANQNGLRKKLSKLSRLFSLGKK